MAAWLTVYCTSSIDQVTAADLIAAIEAADVHADAEVWGIEDEDIVDEALSHLTIEPVTEIDGVRFQLRYGPADAPPILIWVWDGSPPGRRWTKWVTIRNPRRLVCAPSLSTRSRWSDSV
jgi:hypothetical protein